MSVYMENFILPTVEEENTIIGKRMYHNGGPHGYIDNIYPCRMFYERDLRELSFKPITIFYWGNGSGKSTLLNVISRKLELNRIAPYNSGEVFDDYAEYCKYILGYDEEGFLQRIPNGSRIITSDDIFDYMLTIRTNNNDIAENIEEAREEWVKLRFSETVKYDPIQEYEDFRIQMLAKRKNVSRREFIRRTAGKEVKLNSNGETAIEYFNKKLKNDTLYCLDEPENSMSPAMQVQMVKILETKARYCGCQLIIATHSPFILALSGARIYDLDSSPVSIKNWWELENTKIYYEFFKKNSRLFEEKSELIPN